MTNWIKTKDRVPEQQRPDEYMCWDKMAVVVERSSMFDDEPPYRDIQLARYSHYIGRWTDTDDHTVIDCNADIVVTHWIRCKDLVDAAT